jgi:hypothetical protein
MAMRFFPLQASCTHAAGGLDPPARYHRPHGLQAHLLEDDQSQSELEKGEQVRCLVNQAIWSTSPPTEQSQPELEKGKQVRDQSLLQLR